VILLSFLPEILVAGTILVSLFLAVFALHSRGALPVAVSVAAFTGLVYFIFRPDLSFFDGSQAMILSDSFSFFLRLLSLLILGGFSLSIYFHSDLSVRGKQRSVLFLQFFSLFLCGIALSQNLVVFLASSLGMYFCAANIVQVESSGEQSWVNVFRQKSVWVGAWSILMMVLFVVSAYSLRSIRFSDWSGALQSSGSGELAQASLVLLVMICGLMPFACSRFIGKAPVGLAILSFGILIITLCFWIRVGVPVLGAYSGVSKNVSRLFLGSAIAILTLRAAYDSIRTREHHSWLSSIYPVLSGMVFFSILLPGDRSVSALFVLTMGTLFTCILVSHAFLDSEYRNKTLVLIALVAVPGAPPLVMGDRYYQMIYDLLAVSNPIPALGMAMVWLVLLLASTQIIGKVLLVRVSKENQRPFTYGEAFFLAFYLIGVVTLSSLRPQLLSVLNRLPPQNLW
jgi:hypothetical protein